MIIAHLAGGLGNQLFQYAMARQVAHRLGVELKLDLFSYRSDRLRQYGLHAFHIRATPATWREVFQICPGMALSRLLPRPLYERLWQRLEKAGRRPACRPRIGEAAALTCPLRQGRVVAERRLTWDADVDLISDSSLLVGWWQNERYFSPLRPTLLEELRPTAPPDARDEELLRLISADESVALHVRRDDKVGRDEFKATSLEYSHKAMRLMRERLAHPRFFVFSDSPEWTRQHLGGEPDVTLVDHHDKHHPHLDLRLMSACKHQITAASSMSWWAAWLNPRPDKIVTSPPAFHWAAHPAYDTSEILPPSWTVIEAGGD